MSTIVNLRGTSGSGKSTVVHTLLSRYAPEVDVVQHFGAKGNRPLVYRVPISQTRRLFVIGPYASQCGGCDAITDYKNVLPPLLREYASRGDVLFEGLLISGGYGSVGRCLGELEGARNRVVFALLDTPLELCLERIAGRRAARGVHEPLNPKNTEQKFKAAHSSQRKIAEEYGHECVMINHRQPYKEVMSLFGVTVVREPKHG